MKQGGMVCQDCHGSVTNVGNTIENGREAWLQEPDCGAVACHGPNYAANTGQLFRNSKGHGNLFCSACHGSPHAILPTVQANDNVQNITLQGVAGTLNKCVVCHGVIPAGAGPHGIYASEIEYNPTFSNVTFLKDIYPNPISTTATISFILDNENRVCLEIYNMNGQRVRLLLEKHLDAGTYNVSLDTRDIPEGIYFYSLKAGNRTFTKKMLIIK